MKRDTASVMPTKKEMTDLQKWIDHFGQPGRNALEVAVFYLAFRDHRLLKGSALGRQLLKLLQSQIVTQNEFSDIIFPEPKDPEIERAYKKIVKELSNPERVKKMEYFWNEVFPNLKPEDPQGSPPAISKHDQSGRLGSF